MPYQFLKPNTKVLLLAILLGFAFTPEFAFATTPLTAPADSLWGRSEDSISPADARQMRHRARLPYRDLREILGQFQQTCTFLDSMQDHDPESGVFGGLHEGEGGQLWAIIESDNTQEAIRVWCEYADYFEDPDRFRANVEDAWTYCDSFPAWEESAPDNFYAMHNAGWGLVATMGYRNVYGDGRDDYGRRCAEHLIDNVPEITANMQDNLMPLVAGWSAGTLYEYGLEVGNRDYQIEAIRMAEQVKEWIDADPNRLNRNEIWALCGGTAMWGVIRTLVREDTTAVEWISDLLENMDVLAGRGNWNNSWNIWYAHAWLSAYEFIDDEAYLRNAETIIDSLLVQDTDDDGGVPATMGDPNNRDQAWVSAYTAWMGLRNLFDGIPEVDVALLDVVSPSNNRPWLIGSEISFVLKAQQNGSVEFLEDVPLHIAGSWESDSTFDLQGWEPRNIQLPIRWTPQQAGPAELTFVARFEDDADHDNDTIRHSLIIRDGGGIIIVLTDTLGNSIGGSVVFKSLEFPNEIAPTILNIPADDHTGAVWLMNGNYSVHLFPSFPFAEEIRDSLIVAGNDGILFELAPPPLLIINNDTDSTREKYFADPLQELGLPYRLWRNDDGDVPFTNGFDAIIYYAGNRSEESIPDADQTMLAEALREGKSVLVTGQNIAANLAGSDFLENTLHSRFLTDNTRSRQVIGQPGDELMDSIRLLLIGNQGAGNQGSTDGIAATGNAVACAFYSDRGDTVAAVRWSEESGARGLFCAFGIEGISGSGGTTPRVEFMSRALDWLGVPLVVSQKEMPPIPASPLLITGYPNPFNSSVRLTISGNWDRGRFGVSIRDLSGRMVTSIDCGVGGMLVWNGEDSYGNAVSAGNYFVTLDNINAYGNIPPILRVTLVK